MLYLKLAQEKINVNEPLHFKHPVIGIPACYYFVLTLKLVCKDTWPHWVSKYISTSRYQGALQSKLQATFVVEVQTFVCCLCLLCSEMNCIHLGVSGCTEVLFNRGCIKYLPDTDHFHWKECRKNNLILCSIVVIQGDKWEVGSIDHVAGLCHGYIIWALCDLSLCVMLPQLMCFWCFCILETSQK